MQRGIVIGSRINTAQGFSMNGSIDSADVLRWLLYWDKIAYTGIGFNGASISGNHSEDIKYLGSIGVFDTQIVDIQSLDLSSLPAPEKGMSLFGLAGNQFPIASAAARIHLAKLLTKTTGDIWAIGQSGGEELLLPGNAQRTELIDVQLINCLPVPSGPTPFDDILTFKENHRSELERLRCGLDILRERILSSSDERRATDLAIKELSSALTDIKLALNASSIMTVNETVSLYTHNPSLSFWTCLGGLGAGATGFPVDLGVATGLVVPTLFKFLQRSIQGGSNLPHSNSDFAYAFEVTRKLS